MSDGGIESEYRAWAAANNEPIDPVRLKLVQEAEARYRKTHVYGNFFRHIGSKTDAGNIIHYGSDNDELLSRAGTLYFYNNTLLIKQDQNDGAEVFVVLDGKVDMHYRENGEEKVVHMKPTDIFTADIGDEHIACPVGDARILVIEKIGSI